MVNAVFIEGLIYAMMVLGVFMTFRILDFPDMTVDGSFATGACVAAMFIVNGSDLYLGLVVAIIAGIYFIKNTKSFSWYYYNDHALFHKYTHH